MQIRHPFSWRDLFLVLVGASAMHISTTLFAYPDSSSIVINTHLPHWNDSPQSTTTVISTQTTTTTTTSPVNEPSHTVTPINLDLGLTQDFPETSIVAHAPGWTIFRNLYMSNGTLLLLSSDPFSSQFPEIRLMTSTGLPAFNTPENIALREPTKQEMDFISAEEARRRWGGEVGRGDRNRVWTVEGNTLLFNEPAQFLDHYYHFVAELFLGVWAFWFGAFSQNFNRHLPPSSPVSLSSALNQSSFNQHLSPSSAPPITRAIFIHASADGWRDKPGFNAYFLHAVFPSVSVEVSADWADRIVATAPHPGSANVTGKAWHFPLAMLSDRSAANRGEACGSRTQRIAAEPWELMVKRRGLDLVGGWWTGVREAIWRFAGVEGGVYREGEVGAHPVGGRWSWPDAVDAEGGEGFENHVGQAADIPVRDPQLDLPLPEKVVITYINRQGVRRHLIEENHNEMVAALGELVQRKKAVEGKEWELNVVQAEKLSKDEQVRVVARSTILLGVHGNGLTHMVLMKPTRVSAVIELFYPGGFARDYEWTTRALGMRHFSVWNDTYFTHPHEPELGYPEGFQGTSIPVYGPAVAKLVEDRIEGRV